MIIQQIASQTVTYGWDASGNLVSQSGSWVSGKYQYDALERLIQEKTLSITRDYTLEGFNTGRANYADLIGAPQGIPLPSDSVRSPRGEDLIHPLTA